MDGLNVQATQMVAVMIICSFIGFGVKQTTQKKYHKLIPVITGAVGGILGVVCKFIVPEFYNLDILSAISSGIVSGLGSTGLHQLMTQGTTKNKSE